MNTAPVHVGGQVGTTWLVLWEIQGECIPQYGKETRMVKLKCIVGSLLLLFGLCTVAQADPHDGLTPPADRVIKTVRGSYYDMGLQHGFLFRDEILYNLGKMKDWGCDPNDPNEAAAHHAALADTYAAVEAYAPEVFDEIDGIAAGAAVDPNAIKLMTFRAWNLDLCTAVGMQDSSGNVYIGGNIDDPAECYVLMRHEPLDALNYVDMRWAGAAWGCNGMNEKGLGYTLAGMWGTDDWNDPQPASNITTGIIHRKLLENCTTVDEAIDVLAEAHTTPWNAILGDAAGNLAHASCMGSVMGVEYPNDPGNNGIVGSSNHAFVRELVDAMATQGLEPNAQQGSLDRLEVIDDARDDPNYDRTLNDVKALLRNHDNYAAGSGYPSICNDSQAFSSLMETTASGAEYQQALYPACQDTYTGYEVGSAATVLELGGFEANDWGDWTQYIDTSSGSTDPDFVIWDANGIGHSSSYVENPAPSAWGDYSACIQSIGATDRMGVLYQTFTTEPNELVEVSLAWWLNYMDGGGTAYLTVANMASDPGSFTDELWRGTESVTYEVNESETTLGNYFDLVQATFVSNGFVVVGVASEHSGGVTVDARPSITPGDSDLDDDVDNVDFGAVFGNFTGPKNMWFEGTDNTDRADLIYDPNTGNLRMSPLQAAGNVIGSYTIEDTGGQLDPNASYLIPFRVSMDTDTAYQIGQTEFYAEDPNDPNDDEGYESEMGYSGIWDFGDILPTGMTLTQLEAFFETACYAGTLGSGVYDFDLLMARPDPRTWAEGDFDGDGDVDNVDFGIVFGNFTAGSAGGMDFLVTPEPATVALLAIGGVALLRRRRRRRWERGGNPLQR